MFKGDYKHWVTFVIARESHFQREDKNKPLSPRRNSLETMPPLLMDASEQPTIISKPYCKCVALKIAEKVCVGSQCRFCLFDVFCRFLFVWVWGFVFVLFIYKFVGEWGWLSCLFVFCSFVVVLFVCYCVIM